MLKCCGVAVLRCYGKRNALHVDFFLFFVCDSVLDAVLDSAFDAAFDAICDTVFGAVANRYSMRYSARYPMRYPMRYSMRYDACMQNNLMQNANAKQQDAILLKYLTVKNCSTMPYITIIARIGHSQKL